MKIPASRIIPVEGPLPPKYAKAVAAQLAAASANPLVAECMRLLDAYVKAYDQRARYVGSSIADAHTTDDAYNGMLRREEERADAFVARVCNAPDDARRPGLGGGDAMRRTARGWLDAVAQAGADERARERRRVQAALRELSQHGP